MSPAYSPDPAAITALATLTLSARVRAIVNTFQADPEAKLTHTDFSVISRLLALLSPKRDADPSTDYLEAETAALFVFETRGRSFRRLMDADPSTPISTLMYRIISKSLRLISKRIKRDQSLAMGSAGAGGPAGSPKANPQGHAAAERSHRGLEVSNAPTPSLADVLSDLDELALLAADTDSQQLPEPKGLAHGLAGVGGLTGSPKASLQQHAAAEQSARGPDANNAPPLSRLPMNRKQRRAG